MNGAVVTPVRQSIAFRAVSSIAPTVPEGSYRVPTEGTLLAVRRRRLTRIESGGHQSIEGDDFQRPH
jgi:hypothetical protein